MNPHATGATVSWLGPNSFSQTADSVQISDTGTYYVEASLLTCVEKDTFEAAVSNMAMVAQFLSTSDAEPQDSIQFIELSYPNPIHFSWDFDDGTSDTIADPIHFFYLEDTYYVTLLVENSECAAEITKPIVIANPPKGQQTVPEKEHKKEKIRLPEFVKILNAKAYPNPNSGQFTLFVELSAPTKMQIAVFDITGKMIYLKDFNNRERIQQGFSFQGLNQGYYFMVVRTQNEIRTFKIAIVR